MKVGKRNSAYAWGIVVMLLLVWMLNYLDRQVIFTIFPLLQSAMHVSTFQLGMLGTAFLWVYSFCSPWAGFLADRFGRKLLICLSLFLWSVITVLSGCVQSFTQLIILCGFMGVCEACYLPAGLALIASYHGPKTRSRAVSLHYSGTYIGTVLGGALGGWIGASYGWRWVFFIFGAIGTVYAVFLSFAVREPEQAVVEEKTNTDGFGKTAITILRTPGYLRLLSVFAIASICDWAIYTWMPLYLYETYHFSLARAGFTATFFIKAGGFCGLLVGGLLADFWAARYIRGRVLTQCVGLLIAAPCLIASGATRSPHLLYAAMLIFGLGKGMYDGNTMSVMCEGVSAQHRATAFGFLNFAGTFAGGVIAMLAGAMKSTIGLSGTFILCGALMLVGTWITATIRMKPLGEQPAAA
jgi:MFS family permease